MSITNKIIFIALIATVYVGLSFLINKTNKPKVVLLLGFFLGVVLFVIGYTINSGYYAGLFSLTGVIIFLGSLVKFGQLLAEHKRRKSDS